MSTLSTHVLDAVSGEPAAGMRVSLERRSPTEPAWSPLGAGSTDGDGRIRELSPVPLDAGTYRLTFHVDSSGSTGPSSDGFYPEIPIVFRITEERHYHVPLLLSPFAYSTYRGS